MKTPATTPKCNPLPRALIAFIAIVGIFQFCMSVYHSNHGPWQLQDSVFNISKLLTDGHRSLSMNPDEESNLLIAKNYIEGRGYAKINPDSGLYEPSSFHSPQTVFLYEQIIRYSLDFDFYIILYFFASALLHSYSLSVIYRILENEGSRWASLGVFSWGLFPSAIYYINTLFLYESLVTAALIIFVYRISLLQKGVISLKSNIFLITVLLIPMVSLRYHTIPIIALVLLAFLFFNGNIRRRSVIILGFLSFIVVVISLSPSLYKNYMDFGRHILTTQSGDVLWHGANPYARGSWDGSGMVTSRGLSDMPNLNEANQLDKSDYLKSKALQWIIANPSDYIILNLRKLAIYFLPQNYDGGLVGSRWYNPFNAAVYFLFFVGIFLWGKINRIDKWLLIAPVLGSIALTLISFVGYRWRFYAEPFMVIIAVLVCKQLTSYARKSPFFSKARV